MLLYKWTLYIVKVACGYEHSLALTDKGDLYVWGKNDNGQLGIGKVTDIAYPVLVHYLLF